MKNFTSKASLVLFCLLFSILTLYANNPFRVNTEKLNIRSGIGGNSYVVGTVKFGDTVDVANRINPNWYRIKTVDAEGYVRSRFLLPIDLKSGVPINNTGLSKKDKIVVGSIILFILLCIIGLLSLKLKKPLVTDNSAFTTQIVIKQKSVAGAIILTVLFGPFGMFYSTIRGAITMLLLPVLTILISYLIFTGFDKSLGGLFLLANIVFYALFYWFICIIWAAVAASKSNNIQIIQNKLD